MQRRNPQTIKFLDSIKAELHSYGFRFLIGRGQQLNSGDGWRASGFFDEDKRVIKVAGGRRDWLQVLVHEYAHFKQWLETPANVYNADCHANVIVSRWLHGGGKGKASPTIVHKAFRRVMAYERDAEIRAVRIARQYDLPINPKVYAKYANLYIYSHHLMRDSGKWNTVGNPYLSEAIYRIMPTDFSRRADLTIPRTVYKALSKYYLVK